MKRKWWLIPLLTLFGLIVIARFTGGLQYYHIPSGSNEPTIPIGSHLLASNLTKPKLLDFMTYKQASVDNLQGGIWVKRICGMPGDKVQIINGILFVNGRNVDSGLTLKQTYITSLGEANKLDQKWLANPENAYPIQGTDSIHLNLETAVYTSRAIRGRLSIDTTILPQTATVFGHSWTFDNFGPLRVPADKYFVLGDNRHESADSRILGFVDAKDYLGTVVKIF